MNVVPVPSALPIVRPVPTNNAIDGDRKYAAEAVMSERPLDSPIASAAGLSLVDTHHRQPAGRHEPVADRHFERARGEQRPAREITSRSEHAETRKLASMSSGAPQPKLPRPGTGLLREFHDWRHRQANGPLARLDQLHFAGQEHVPESAEARAVVEARLVVGHRDAELCALGDAEASIDDRKIGLTAEERAIVADRDRRPGITRR